MKAYIYCRVVPSNNISDFSDNLESQEARCKKFCQKNGHSIKRIYKDEGAMHNGTFLPKMRALLNDITHEKEEVLVLSDTVLRLGLLEKTRSKLKKTINQKGAQFIATDEDSSRLTAFIVEEHYQLTLENGEDR